CLLRRTRAAPAIRGRARRAPSCGSRPADPSLLGSRRSARRRPPHGTHRPGQEGQAQQADIHPGACDRRKLCRARCRCRRSPCLSSRETRRAMTAYDWFVLVVIILCILLSAFFAGSETALTASSRASMHRLDKQGNHRAVLVNHLLSPRERMIGALLFGNNTVNIAASALATGLLVDWFGEVGVVYATVVMTVAIVVFAEILPKTAAFNAPNRIALAVARPIDWTVRLLAPILVAVEWIVKKAL